jgi:hypothetical protein
MNELTPERLLYRESWRERIQAHIGRKVVKVMETIDNHLYHGEIDDEDEEEMLAC